MTHFYAPNSKTILEDLGATFFDAFSCDTTFWRCIFSGDATFAQDVNHPAESPDESSRVAWRAYYVCWDGLGGCVKWEQDAPDPGCIFGAW